MSRASTQPDIRVAAAEPHDATSASAAGRQIRARRAAQISIAGVGAVATAAAIVILGSALPRLSEANAALASTPYKASVPGPGCDAKGALWTITPGEPITTECTRAGLHVEIAPGPIDEGDIEFLPPSGFSSENYRISVQVTFSSRFDGCAGIFTRSSAAGRYLTVICGDHSVEIIKQGDHASSIIYLNYVGRALTYTIAAVSQGPDQSVYVNGTEIGAVTNAAFAKTEYIGLGIVNSSRSAQAVVFSSFSFTQ